MLNGVCTAPIEEISNCLLLSSANACEVCLPGFILVDGKDPSKAESVVLNYCK